MSPEQRILCSQPWEALSGDPLPWLLDTCGPSVRWRALLDVFDRPRDAPAVIRARGSASATEPIASLLADLQPDGSWPESSSTWRYYSGAGWRLLSAVQLGADTFDPRLRSAAERLLHGGSNWVGIGAELDSEAAACLTARSLAACAALGQGRDPRFEEALASLEEAPAGSGGSGWACPYPAHQQHPGGCAVAAVGVLATLLELDGHRRRDLRSRAVKAVRQHIGSGCSRGAYRALGEVNLMRTDVAEMLYLLARSGVAFSHRLRPALVVLQKRQISGGRWPLTLAAPASLPGLADRRPGPGAASPWVTLRSVVAIMGFAVESRLPRMYPQRPDAT